MYQRIAVQTTRFCALLALLMLFGVTSAAQDTTEEINSFLQKQTGFRAGELSSLQRGEAVVKFLKTGNSREVAVFGIIRINAPKEVVLEKYKGALTSRSGGAILQVGRFSNPPRIADLKGLTFDPKDIEDIKKCKIGNCDVKMSAGAIERLRKEISAPVSTEKASALARQMLLEYVDAYRAGGNSALVEYHDKKNAVRLADEMRGLLGQSPYLFEYVPELHRYLEEYPKSQPSNLEDFIFWSKQKFGLKPVVSVTHFITYKRLNADHTIIVAAEKQLYASHYFDALLGLTTYVDDPASPKSASYFVYLNRSRADALRGGFSGLKRSIVQNRIRDGLKKTLRSLKQSLEAKTRPR